MTIVERERDGPGEQPAENYFAKNFLQQIISVNSQTIFQIISLSSQTFLLFISLFYLSPLPNYQKLLKIILDCFRLHSKSPKMAQGDLEAEIASNNWSTFLVLSDDDDDDVESVNKHLHWPSGGTGLRYNQCTDGRGLAQLLYLHNYM